MLTGHLEQPKCPEVGSLLSKLWYIELMKQDRAIKQIIIKIGKECRELTWSCRSYTYYVELCEVDNIWTKMTAESMGEIKMVYYVSGI